MHVGTAKTQEILSLLLQNQLTYKLVALFHS